MSPGKWISQIKPAAMKLAAFMRPKPPDMIGTPPSARKLSAIPTDPAEHARRFARDWADVVDSYVQKRMRELGISGHQVGAIDYVQGGIRRVFEPEEHRGGTNDLFGRIYVDSGVFDPTLNAERFGSDVMAIWAKSRLRDRIDAVIAHEYSEVESRSHELAEVRSPNTSLPIREGARRILRAIASLPGAKGVEP